MIATTSDDTEVTMRVWSTSRAVGLLFPTIFLVGGSIANASPPDLSKIDRHIAKEPKYIAEHPLYGMYVFGPQAKTRMWAVLDKSRRDATSYDVLYFDRHANGDLTAADDRIVGQSQDGLVSFGIPDFTDPATGDHHTGVSMRYRQNGSVGFTMKWRDRVEVNGGYASHSGPYTQFTTSPADAPIVWPGADAPLTFQFWELQPLVIGNAADVRVFLGHQGYGPATFCALPDTFLPPTVPVLATLVYTDKTGKERWAQSELRERC
jgi:hypothetical protein